MKNSKIKRSSGTTKKNNMNCKTKVITDATPYIAEDLPSALEMIRTSPVALVPFTTPRNESFFLASNTDRINMWKHTNYNLLQKYQIDQIPENSIDENTGSFDVEGWRERYWDDIWKNFEPFISDRILPLHGGDMEAHMLMDNNVQVALMCIHGPHFRVFPGNIHVNIKTSSKIQPGTVTLTREMRLKLPVSNNANVCFWSGETPLARELDFDSHDNLLLTEKVRNHPYIRLKRTNLIYNGDKYFAMVRPNVLLERDSLLAKMEIELLPYTRLEFDPEIMTKRSKYAQDQQPELFEHRGFSTNYLSTVKICTLMGLPAPVSLESRENYFLCPPNSNSKVYPIIRFGSHPRKFNFFVDFKPMYHYSDNYIEENKDIADVLIDIYGIDISNMERQDQLLDSFLKHIYGEDDDEEDLYEREQKHELLPQQLYFTEGWEPLLWVRRGFGEDVDYEYPEHIETLYERSVGKFFSSRTRRIEEIENIF